MYYVWSVLPSAVGGGPFFFIRGYFDHLDDNSFQG
jgi:hypothetical protein